MRPRRQKPIFKRLQKADNLVGMKKEKYRVALSKQGKGTGPNKERFNSKNAELCTALANELTNLLRHRKKLKIAYENRKVSHFKIVTGIAVSPAFSV